MEVDGDLEKSIFIESEGKRLISVGSGKVGRNSRNGQLLNIFIVKRIREMR